MNNQTLIHSSVIAAVFIAAVIGVSMLTGFTGAAPFISVDPIGDKNIGEIFTVSGTTNLPAGTELRIEVAPVSFNEEDSVNGGFSGAVGNADVIDGSGGANTWSMEVNTSTLNPVKMVVNVSVFTGDVLKGDFSTGGPIGTREFTLRPLSGMKGKSLIQGQESGDFISIDPVPERTTGDLLIVTGSTNLPPGTILMVQAGGDGAGYGSDTIVREGNGGTNTFSVPLDTAMMKPGLRTISVTRMKGDLAKGDYGPGILNGTTTFTLKGTYLGSDTPVQPAIDRDDYIRLDRIGDHTAGDQFLVTGKTNLPVGTNILWQIIPESEQLMTGQNHMPDKGIMANNAVTKGDGTENRVSLAVDTGNFPPGEYIAVAAVMKGDIATGDVGMGDLAGSASFSLK